MHPKITLLAVCATLVFASLVNSSEAFSFRRIFGGCPDYKVKEDFNLDRYTGKWYELGRTWFLPEEGGVCSTAEYEIDPKNPKQITVKNVMRKGSISGDIESVEGYAKPKRDDKKADLEVDFGFGRKGTLQILETDYETYSMAYSCTQLGPFLHWETAWILARSIDNADEDYENIKKKFSDIGFDSSAFKKTKQDPKCHQTQPIMSKVSK